MEHLTLILPLLLFSTVSVVFGSGLVLNAPPATIYKRLGTFCMTVGLVGFWSAALFPEYMHHSDKAVAIHREHPVYALDGAYHDVRFERLIDRTLGSGMTVAQAIDAGLRSCPDCGESAE